MYPDIANPKSNKKNAGFTQEERDGFSKLLEGGFIDSFRSLHPDEDKAYTFWTAMGNCRAKNVGWSVKMFSHLRSILSSVPLVKSLHWLPVHYRIIFNFFTIPYQALSSTQPAYLNSMLTPARNSRQLRSTSSNPLYIPQVKMKAGTRAFSVAALTVWNSLPASVSCSNLLEFFTVHSNMCKITRWIWGTFLFKRGALDQKVAFRFP